MLQSCPTSSSTTPVKPKGILKTPNKSPNAKFIKASPFKMPTPMKTINVSPNRKQQTTPVKSKGNLETPTKVRQRSPFKMPTPVKTIGIKDQKNEEQLSSNEECVLNSSPVKSKEILKSPNGKENDKISSKNESKCISGEDETKQVCSSDNDDQENTKPKRDKIRKRRLVLNKSNLDKECNNSDVIEHKTPVKISLKRKRNPDEELISKRKKSNSIGKTPETPDGERRSTPRSRTLVERFGIDDVPLNALISPSGKAKNMTSASPSGKAKNNVTASPSGNAKNVTSASPGKSLASDKVKNIPTASDKEKVKIESDSSPDEVKNDPIMSKSNAKLSPEKVKMSKAKNCSYYYSPPGKVKNSPMASKTRNKKKKLSVKSNIASKVVLDEETEMIEDLENKEETKPEDSCWSVAGITESPKGEIKVKMNRNPSSSQVIQQRLSRRSAVDIGISPGKLEKLIYHSPSPKKPIAKGKGQGNYSPLSMMSLYNLTKSPLASGSQNEEKKKKSKKKVNKKLYN